MKIELEMEDQVGAAASYFQLGRLYTAIGDLDRAMEYVWRSLEISEVLELPEVFKCYHSLAEIAEALGDSAGAAEWVAKRDAKIAELERLGAGVPALG